jgi:hypothetical protein
MASSRGGPRQGGPDHGEAVVGSNVCDRDRALGQGVARAICFKPRAPLTPTVRFASRMNGTNRQPEDGTGAAVCGRLGPFPREGFSKLQFRQDATKLVFDHQAMPAYVPAFMSSLRAPHCRGGQLPASPEPALKRSMRPRCLAPRRTPAVSDEGSSSALPRGDGW